MMNKACTAISKKLTWVSKTAFDASWKKIKESWVSWKEFMQKLAYKWFDHKLTWWTTSLVWAWISSSEEIWSIYESIIDDNKKLDTRDNAENLAKIAMNLFMFKQLWILRTVTYNLLFDKLFSDETVTTK
jgi:hypothetical protein